MATGWDNESEDWNAAEEAQDSTWAARRSSWTGAREERGRSWNRVGNPVGYSVDMTENYRGRPHPNAFNVYGHSGRRWRSHSESGTSWSSSSWYDAGRASSDSGRSWEHVSQDSEFKEPENSEDSSSTDDSGDPEKPEVGDWLCERIFDRVVHWNGRLAHMCADCVREGHEETKYSKAVIAEQGYLDHFYDLTEGDGARFEAALRWEKVRRKKEGSINSSWSWPRNEPNDRHDNWRQGRPRDSEGRGRSSGASSSSGLPAASSGDS